MGRLYVFMGKSAAGKDTLYRRVLAECPELTAVVPYTTRPIRRGETPGKDYRFVSEAEMAQMEKDDRIIESRCYQTVKGPWYYFTAEDGQIDFDRGDYCLISTLEGYERIRDHYGADNVIPLYIEAGDFERIQRSLERERSQRTPCVAEVCRRFLADEQDFSAEKLAKAGIKDRVWNEDLQKASCQIKAIIKNGR